MDVLLHGKTEAGRVRRFRDVPYEVANRMFEAHRKILDSPSVTYYRVTLEDPMRGGYIVRDSYTEEGEAPPQ
jgi:hypothetical protein